MRKVIKNMIGFILFAILALYFVVLYIAWCIIDLASDGLHPVDAIVLLLLVVMLFCLVFGI